MASIARPSSGALFVYLNWKAASHCSIVAAAALKTGQSAFANSSISCSYFLCSYMSCSLRARITARCRSFIYFPLFQLAHIHIAAPAISNMTPVIAFPPIAVCLQRCCQCDVLLLKFDCRYVQVLNQAKAFQPLIVETLAV